MIDRLANLKYRERFADADDLVFTREGEHMNHCDLRRDDAAKLAEAFEIEDNDPVDLPEKEEA